MVVGSSSHFSPAFFKETVCYLTGNDIKTLSNTAIPALRQKGARHRKKSRRKSRKLVADMFETMHRQPWHRAGGAAGRKSAADFTVIDVREAKGPSVLAGMWTANPPT